MPGKKMECSVNAYGKLLGVRGEKRLMGVWKEMGWDGMNMELAEKIYKRKVATIENMFYCENTFDRACNEDVQAQNLPSYTHLCSLSIICSQYRMCSLARSTKRKVAPSLTPHYASNEKKNFFYVHQTLKYSSDPV